MKTAKTGLLFNQGDLWSRRLTWRQAGAPLILNYLQEVVVEVCSDDATLGQATLSGGTVRVWPESGAMDFFINDTADAPAGFYRLYVRITFLDGTIKRLPAIPVQVSSDGCDGPTPGGVNYV